MSIKDLFFCIDWKHSSLFNCLIVKLECFLNNFIMPILINMVNFLLFEENMYLHIQNSVHSFIAKKKITIKKGYNKPITIKTEKLKFIIAIVNNSVHLLYTCIFVDGHVCI